MSHYSSPFFSAPRASTLTSQVFLVFVLFLVVGCTQGAEERTLDVELEPALEIGAAEENGPYLFGSISQVAVGTDGTIFVADAQMHEIRAFDEEGHHLHSFGAAGEGPGEFQSITAMTVDSNNRLLIADQRNARITVFDANGSYRRSHSSPTPSAIRHLQELPNGDFLIVGVLDDHLVHIVSEDFQDVKHQMASTTDMVHTDHYVEPLAMQFYPGHAVALDQDEILFAPFTYSGELHLYTRTEDATWNHERLETEAPVSGRSLIIGDEARSALLHLPMQLQQDGESQRHILSFQAVSNGLFRLDDGRILHLFSRRIDDSGELIGEVISASRTHEGSFIAHSLPADDLPQLSVHQLDESNQLYLTDHREYPIVRRVHLLLTE